MAAVRDQAVLGGRTPSGEYTDLASSVGVMINSLDAEQTSRAGVLSSLSALEQSVVGVDVNEELMKLMDYQRMVEGAARFISTMNEAMDSIFEMTR
jgi:flagellar hook-associated protein 1 FlgK